MSDILEDLDRRHVDMFNSGEVKDDSFESRTRISSNVLWINVPKTNELQNKTKQNKRTAIEKRTNNTYVPGSITQPGIRIRIRPLRLRLHNLDKLIRMGPSARIQQTLPHAVNKDSRVRPIRVVEGDIQCPCRIQSKFAIRPYFYPIKEVASRLGNLVQEKTTC